MRSLGFVNCCRDRNIYEPVCGGCGVIEGLDSSEGAVKLIDDPEEDPTFLCYVCMNEFRKGENVYFDNDNYVELTEEEIVFWQKGRKLRRKHKNAKTLLMNAARTYVREVGIDNLKSLRDVLDEILDECREDFELR